MKVMIETGAFAPERAHDTDAGLDLRAQETRIVKAGGSAVFDTGVHVQIPEGCAGLLVSKSGLNVNHNITSTGLIDEGYEGSIRVKLYNQGNRDYLVQREDKIGQLVIIPVRYEKIEIVESIENGSERGSNGFGSSGR